MTTRKILLALVGVVLVAGAMVPATVAFARPRPEGHLAGRRFEANKTFGLGLELGGPSGITGKYFLSPDRALDFGFGYISTAYRERSGFHIYGDYLFHPVSLVSVPEFELPLYVGLGGRFWNFEDRLGDGMIDSASAIGFRVPVGVAFDFNNVPLDAFLQLTPVLDFFSGYSRHSVYIDIDISIGVRYWFN
jgi:hypothetical protein